MRLLFLTCFLLMSFQGAKAQDLFIQESSVPEKTLNREEAAVYVQQLIDSNNKYEQEKNFGKALHFSMTALAYEDLLDSLSMVKVDLHRAIGRQMGFLGATKECVYHMRKAIQIHFAMNGQYNWQDYMAQGTIGGSFWNGDQPDSSLAAYHKALDIAKAIESDLYMASSHNNLGIFYAQMGGYDSALYHYNIALTNLDFKDIEDTLLSGSIKDNLAQLAEKREDYTTALGTYLDMMRHFGEGKPLLAKRRVNSGLAAGRVFLKIGDPKALLPILETIDELFAQYPKLKKDYLIDYYPLRKEYYLAQNDQSRALRYSKLEIELKDSLIAFESMQEDEVRNLMNEYRLNSINQELEVQRLRNSQQTIQLQLADQQAANNRLWLLVLAIGSVLIIGGIIMYAARRASLMRMHQQVAELELKNRELEAEQLKQKVHNQKRDLTDFALDNSRKREWIQEVVQRLDELQAEDPARLRLAIKRMGLELHNELATDGRMQLFQDNVDQVNQEFYHDLLEKFPKLTKWERELCGLIRLNLSSKEIANLRNVDPQSVIKSRYRLRKKLGLTQEEDLDAFLHQL